MLGYLLSDDLIFVSRIVGSARALDLEMKTARSPAQLFNLLAEQQPSCLILDLNHAGLDIADLLQRLPSPQPFVVGYGSHVDAGTLQAARKAGCNVVLPRSQFVEQLPTHLQGWFAPPTS